MNRVEELTLNWLDGLLDDQEVEELQRLVAEDSEALDVHVSLCDIEAALRSRDERFDVQEAVMNRLHTADLAAPSPASEQNRRSNFEDWADTYQAKIRRQRFMVAGWAVAASLLVAVGVNIVMVDRGASLQVPTIAQTNDGVVIGRNGQRISAAAGLDLKKGDEITVPADAVTSIKYPDGTRVVIGSNTSVTLQSNVDAAEKKLFMKQGDITAHVAKQFAGRSLSITTPRARATVLGTRFRLSTSQDSSRLDVIEGRVALVRTADGAEVVVTQGQFAIAAPNTDLAARSLSPRSDSDLLVLYRFDEGEGTTIHDQSGFGQPLDLQIEPQKAVKWLPDGGLQLHAPALLASKKPARKITDACRRTNELTIEAWITPAIIEQGGPARLVSLSKNPSERNFTLGQDARENRNFFTARLRTTSTSTNGIPAVESLRDWVVADLVHVVYTRNKNGDARIYVDGVPRVHDKVAGDFSKWNDVYRLILGNEFTRDRPWLGEYHLVAIYNRALGPDDVLQNFRFGP